MGVEMDLLRAKVKSVRILWAQGDWGRVGKEWPAVMGDVQPNRSNRLMSLDLNDTLALDPSALEGLPVDFETLDC
jgi:hypothetical protein